MEVHSLYRTQFASTYGSSAYGAGTYDCVSGQNCTTGTGTTSSIPLQDTGVSIYLPLVVSVCLIVAAVLLLFMRKKA